MKGYVALTTILIIIPLLLLTGVDSVYRNMTTLIVGKMNYDYQILQVNTDTCFEETVYRVKRTPSLTGDIQVSGEGWVCDINIANKVGEAGIKTVSITATDDKDIKITVSKELNTNTNPFEVTNIQ